MDELLTQAIENAERFKIGKVFTVRELFDYDYWTSIPKGERQLLGRNFKQEVNTNSVCGVICVESRKGTVAKYVRKGNEEN